MRWVCLVTGKERRKCLKGSSEKMDLSKRRQEVGWPHFRSISSRRRIPGRRKKRFSMMTLKEILNYNNNA
jgi:hypothetical protein